MNKIITALMTGHPVVILAAVMVLTGCALVAHYLVKTRKKTV